tara:strand:- start:1552 stop:2259 length:708 start_codon:yes stop_codon:yes gene_type:complete
MVKAVILAGGYGTRISEETHLRPKPMIEIGGMPMLWHIMKIYSSYGINEFVICCGYKAEVIKEYFDSFDLDTWNVQLVDTGLDTMTGGRLKRIQKYVDNETFCFTYGDGLANISIDNLIKFHNNNNTIATVTAVQPPARFGALELNQNKVVSFTEKPPGDGNWINGGYFVLEPSVFDYLGDDSTVWEKEPIENLAKNNQLSAYRHSGFWQPLDTLREKNKLEELWSNGNPPWKIW